MFSTISVCGFQGCSILSYWLIYSHVEINHWGPQLVMHRGVFFACLSPCSSIVLAFWDVHDYNLFALGKGNALLLNCNMNDVVVD